MIRTRVIIATALLMVSFSVIAQPRLRQPEIYLGVQGGVVASTVIFNPEIAEMSPLLNSVILGGNGGLVFRYNAQKYCGIQVELNYMQRGWREKGSEQIGSTTFDINYTRRLHYLTLPMLMHLYFGSPSWRFIINAGPQIAFCVKDDWQTGIGEKAQSFHEEYDQITHPMDWGLAGGIGLVYRSRKSGSYQLEARFNYSFGTLYSDRSTEYFAKSNSMNLSLNIAWLWEFKKKEKTTKKQ